jgi:uncharacterized protein (DUF362 family)
VSRYPVSRRAFVRAAGAAAGLTALGLTESQVRGAARPPTSPVVLARCDTYELGDVAKCLATMMEQLGGLERLVVGKTVGVKVNLAGVSREPVRGLSPGRTYQVHPSVVHALVIVLDRAGARRIRLLENGQVTTPLEHSLALAGWDLNAVRSLKAAVEFEDTRNMGSGKHYPGVKVPWGGSLYPWYYLNHSYTSCDVYVSLAKLKNHVTAGVTLSMKNNFGITPKALYGQSTHDEASTENRLDMLHMGKIAPPKGLPTEVDATAPRRPTYRVPRVIVDMVGIRPIDLAIIDGIETVSGGEGPWVQGLKLQKPKLLIAGRNPVCTDAIACACMGYSPTAGSGTGPFPGDNHLALAAQQNLGTHNPEEIEARGLTLQEALHPFGWEPKTRHF